MVEILKKTANSRSLSIIKLYCICDVGDGSSDIRNILSAIGETDLTETLALQEAIMQSQLATVTTAGITAGIIDF